MLVRLTRAKVLSGDHVEYITEDANKAYWSALGEKNSIILLQIFLIKAFSNKLYFSSVYQGK